MAAVNTIETTMDTNVEVRSPLGRRFVTVWAGQTVSIVGSTVSAVGAAVYAYAETGSAVWLGLLAGFAALPAVLAAPAMTVVDRLPRRTMMLAGDSFAALGPTFALVLALTGRLEVWHLVAAAFVGELGTAFQSPAAQAAVPLLVPHDALDRANSLAQLGPALGIVVGPLVAAPLVAWWARAAPVGRSGGSPTRRPSPPGPGPGPHASEPPYRPRYGGSAVPTGTAGMVSRPGSPGSRR